VVSSVGVQVLDPFMMTMLLHACPFDLSAPAAGLALATGSPPVFLARLNSSILEAIFMQEKRVIHCIRFYSISLTS
jgi:hypothetical protein